MSHITNVLVLGYVTQEEITTFNSHYYRLAVENGDSPLRAAQQIKEVSMDEAGGLKFFGSIWACAYNYRDHDAFVDAIKLTWPDDPPQILENTETSIYAEYKPSLNE